jgi:hypothetical protein
MDIQKNDLVLEITGASGYVGRIYISKGSIDFLPKNKQYNTLSLSWDKFAKLMEKLDKKRRKKRRPGKKK